MKRRGLIKSDIFSRLLVSRSQEDQRITEYMSSLTSGRLSLQSSVINLDNRLLEVSKSITTLSANITTTRESGDLTVEGFEYMVGGKATLYENCAERPRQRLRGVCRTLLRN